MAGGISNNPPQPLTILMPTDTFSLPVVPLEPSYLCINYGIWAKN